MKPASEEIFRNHVARYRWGFMGFFMIGLLAMSYVLFRDGPPPGYSYLGIWAIVALFWIGGLGASAFVASKACTTLTVAADGTIQCVHRYPFHRDVRIFAATDIRCAEVVKTRDNEGDPYFIARLELRDGSQIDIGEGHDRDTCESIRSRFIAALPANPARSGK